MSVLLIDGWYDLHKSDNNYNTIERKIRIGMTEEELAKRKASLISKYSLGEQNELPKIWHITPHEFLRIILNFHSDKEDKYYSEYGAKFDFLGFAYLLNDKKDNEIIKQNLYEYVSKARGGGFLDTIRKRLVQLLDESDQRSYELCGKIIIWLNKLDTSGRDEDWVDVLYSYIYFAVKNCLPPHVAYERYKELKEDLREYNEKVTFGYGCSGVPGLTKIYNMANRKNPNIIALFEMGELEYYGRGFSEFPNYNKAYDYYTATIRLNKEHPLALWSIAYMKFNYKKKGTELENAKIDEFELYYYNNFEKNSSIYLNSKNNWYDDILSKVVKSYEYDCAAAANLIGKVLDDADVPKRCINNFGVLTNKDSKYFYKKSADSGYVYGCNNYAKKCMDEAMASHIIRKQKELVEEALIYYKKSADLGEAYAMNLLGQYYYDGVLIDKNIIIEKDEELAYSYYLRGLKMSGIKKYYWPLINLCEKFWLVKTNKYTYYESTEIDMYEIQRLLKTAVRNVEKLDQLKGLKRVCEKIKEKSNIAELEDEISFREQFFR